VRKVEMSALVLILSPASSPLASYRRSKPARSRSMPEWVALVTGTRLSASALTVHARETFLESFFNFEKMNKYAGICFFS
jgi:hypothetical protein